MKNILIIGAGKSSSSLIKYLLDKSDEENLQLTIGDLSTKNAEKLINNHKNAKAIILDVFDEHQREKEIGKTDLVISMLPARFHVNVAKDCIKFKKHLVTASYVSKEMKALDEAAKENDLIFMNEIGLDPGLDHMSAMQVIDRIRDNDAKIVLFESFCGGLVAPESDTNLWNYKFTWNPRNVVLAGQGGAAMFIQESTYKYIPYHKLFRRTEFLIIENKKSWEYLQKNKLLTQVEELKSNFLRMMSHDLKTPLARTSGMTELALQDETPLSTKQTQALENIGRSSIELSDFIGSVLDLSRVENNEFKLHLHSNDIHTILDKVIYKCEFLAQHKNIQVITEFEPLFSVKLDPQLMTQVFTNLIENAIKYSPENTKILVLTEEVDGKLIVQVSDQGRGIPNDELPSVFKKFYRSRHVVNTDTSGTGLGLFLSQYFVELHKGSISVESEEGQGSTFTVALPVDRQNVDGNV